MVAATLAALLAHFGTLGWAADPALAAQHARFAELAPLNSPARLSSFSSVTCQTVAGSPQGTETKSYPASVAVDGDQATVVFHSSGLDSALSFQLESFGLVHRWSMTSGTKHYRAGAELRIDDRRGTFLMNMTPLDLDGSKIHQEPWMQNSDAVWECFPPQIS